MQYNTAGQRLWARAFNGNGYVEDDEANITGDLIIDGGTPIALGNPTQAAGKLGYYYWTLTAVQTVGHALTGIAESATAGVQVQVVPPVIYIARTTDTAIQAAEGLIWFEGETNDYNMATDADYTGKILSLVIAGKDLSPIEIEAADISITPTYITYAKPSAATANRPRCWPTSRPTYCPQPTTDRERRPRTC